MSEAEHTPGPWRAHVMTTGYLIKQEPGHGDRRVAGLRMADADSGFANACLMAAAPEMLDVCAAFAAFRNDAGEVVLAIHGVEIIRFKSDESERATAILKLGEMRRAAIAKAEGAS